MSTRRTLATAALAGALLVGGATAAEASPSAPPKDRTEQICAHKDEIAKSLANHKAAAQKRIANLEKAVARATANHRPRAAARLQKALDRAKRHLAAIDARIARLAKFVAEHCD